MAQSKAKICLFRILLLQLFAVSLFAGQIAAATINQTDAHRDLEEIELEYATELRLASRFTSKFDAGSFYQTDCDFFERAKRLDAKTGLIPSPAESRESADLVLEQSDFPSDPETDGAQPTVKMRAPTVDDLAAAEAGQSDEVRHHQISPSRPVWETVSGFVAAQRARLSKSVRSAEHNFKGFYDWVDLRIDEAKLLAEKTDQKSKTVSASEQLSAVRGIETPMFLIPDVKESFEVKDIEKAIAQRLTLVIPMFQVVDAEVASEILESDIPGDLFTAKPHSPASIELEGPQRDPYWQYYDDCDRWGVDFAKLINDAQYEQTSISTDNSDVSFVAKGDESTDNK